MARFIGRYDYSIDEKGRLNIPSKFRRMLSPQAAETFVICRAPDSSLWAYPLDEWQRVEEMLEAMPFTRESNKIRRMIYQSATYSTLDRQGRITLMPAQTAVAGIRKNVTLVGSGRHIEIWDTARFDAYIGPGDDFDDYFYQAAGEGMRPRE